MSVKKQSVIRKIISGLTGEVQFQKADRILREMFLECEEAEYREKINYVRKIIRQYRKKQKKKIVISGSLLCMVFIISLIWSGVHLAGDHIKDAQTGVSTEKPQSVVEYDTEKITEKTTELIEPTELLLTFTGDCILGTDEFFAWDTGFNAYYEMYGPEYFLDNVRDIFRKDDLTIINMEGTLTEETTRLDKQFAFKGDPEFVDILASSSIEAANVANNHSHDYGEQSFLDTVDLLEKNDIKTFGYDDTTVITVKNVKVGFFGIYELDDHLARIPQVKSNIARLEEDGADIIVAVFHWSNELVTVPDENQVTLAHLAIDEGADVVVGHHPHVVQGIDTYKGKTIAYSLGNFCFGGNTHPTEMDTMIFQQKFMVDAHKEIIDSEINVIPCSVSSEISFNNYQPTVLTGTEAQRVLDVIEQRSEAI
ncbi:MAG: CapA family protein [Eubacteriales bacterium]|nr:CapA family protein [Eubacteriales bacterium]